MRIASLPANGREVPSRKVQTLLDAATPDLDRRDTVTLPGPTGESNRLSVVPRGTVLCLGPSVEEAQAQIEADLARLKQVVRQVWDNEDVLAKRRGNSPLLVGAPGVGKTSVVYGLAYAFAEQVRAAIDAFVTELRATQGN